MREEFGEDLSLPRSEFYQASRAVSFREATKGFDKLRDDFAFRLRRVGLRG